MHEEGGHTLSLRVRWREQHLERIVGGRLRSRMRKAREQGRRLGQTLEDEEDDRKMKRTKVQE